MNIRTLVQKIDNITDMPPIESDLMHIIQRKEGEEEQSFLDEGAMAYIGHGPSLCSLYDSSLYGRMTMNECHDDGQSEIRSWLLLAQSACSSVSKQAGVQDTLH